MPDQPIDVSALPVHPAADVFPMLSDEELADLADDIKVNGLLQPLVVAKVDGEWTLIDGRNRREACRRAGVEPAVTDLNGTDPLSYIISSNLRRRHMLRSQRAMAMAMISPEAETAKERGGRASKILLACNDDERNAMRVAINKARVVLLVTPTAVDRVLAGTLTLDAAYKAADAEGKREQLERDWLGENAPSAESPDTDPLPDAAVLDRVAQAIKSIALALYDAHGLAGGRVGADQATTSRKGIGRCLTNARSLRSSSAIATGRTMATLLCWPSRSLTRACSSRSA